MEVSGAEDVVRDGFGNDRIGIGKGMITMEDDMVVIERRGMRTAEECI